MNNIIETSGLTKEYFSNKVICSLDLQIEKGELFGFLGPNGAGKTTTIRILTTLTKPTSGHMHSLTVLMWLKSHIRLSPNLGLFSSTLA